MGAENWHDPHGIIPDSFREEFGDSETVADALRRAESRSTTTPLGEQPRCPECHSRQVTPKASKMHTLDWEEEPNYRCCADGCYAHFNEPIYTTKIMTESRTQSFNWIESEDDLADPETRAIGPLFAGLDDETLTALALVLREPWGDEHPSYRTLEALFPYSRTWVGDRAREWRDGEHRDLVPDPSADPDAITVDDAAASSDAVATDGGRRRWDAYGSD